jgi:hypothetical protein
MGNNWKQIAGRDGGHTKEKRLRHCGAWNRIKAEVPVELAGVKQILDTRIYSDNRLR